MDRQRPHRRTEIHHADVGRPRHSIAPLLAGDWASVIGKYGAIPTADSHDRYAGPGVGEFLVGALVDSLQAIDLAPRHSPPAPFTLQPCKRTVQCGERRSSVVERLRPAVIES